MNKLRIGLVGVGGMGGCHFDNYMDVDGAELVAVCDVRKEVAEKKVGNRKINIYTDLGKMLKKEELDMVDICTPSYMHMDMVIKLLKKGYHVLCEKPMTLNNGDCKKIIKTLKNTDKNFMVAHVVRFMAPYKYLKSVIDSNELGSLIRLDMKRISSIPTWSWEDWMRKEKLSGGVVTDLSIHDLDFVQSIFGMPKKVQAVHYKMKNNNDCIVSNLIYDNLSVSCEGTWYNTDIPFQAKFLAVFQNGYVQFDNGKLVKNGKEITLGSYKRNGEDIGINVGNDNGYFNEIQYFIDCANEGRKPDFITPESSAKSVELADLIKKKAVVVNK